MCMTVEAPLEVNTNSYPVQQALVRGRGAVDGVQARLEAQVIIRHHSNR